MLSSPVIEFGCNRLLPVIGGISSGNLGKECLEGHVQSGLPRGSHSAVGG